ncbi:MAG: hypothetical protein Q9186_005223 [Xanthomendoza sp. 1 TL-2023]
MSQADLDRSRELFRALNSSISPIAPTIWTPRPDDFLPGTTGPWNPSEMPRQHVSPASHTGPWNPPCMPRHDPFARSAVDWRRRPTPNRFGTIGDGRPVRTQVIGATIVPVPVVRPRGRDDNAAMEQGCANHADPPRGSTDGPASRPPPSPQQRSPGWPSPPKPAQRPVSPWSPLDDAPWPPSSPARPASVVPSPPPQRPPPAAPKSPSALPCPSDEGPRERLNTTTTPARNKGKGKAISDDSPPPTASSSAAVEASAPSTKELHARLIAKGNAFDAALKKREAEAEAQAEALRRRQHQELIQQQRRQHRELIQQQQQELARRAEMARMAQVRGFERGRLRARGVRWYRGLIEREVHLGRRVLMQEVLEMELGMGAGRM